MNGNDITGDTAVYVSELQTYLRTIQRRRTGSTFVPQDGLYGSTTAAAVRVFQQEQGLPETGIAEKKTWDEIYRVYTEEQAAAAPPYPIPLAFGEDLLLRPGDTGDSVAFLQIMLRRIGKNFDNIPSIPPEVGTYTAATELAVTAIQEVTGLPVTGQADKATWNAVTALFRQP